MTAFWKITQTVRLLVMSSGTPPSLHIKNNVQFQIEFHSTKVLPDAVEVR